MSIGALDKSLPVPLYHQLKTVLMTAIDSGKWQPDQQIPNESQLAEMFGVSKITVRQALQDLAQLGYIRREQGRGTFVSKPKFGEGPRELTSFTEEMLQHRLKPGARVLEQGLTEADPKVAEVLGIGAAAPVYMLKRLRLANGEPLGIQTAHIPAALVPDLERQDMTDLSLYDVLQSRYGLHAARATETYHAVLAQPKTVELLGIAPNSPVFAVERVTRLPNGRPFEFVYTIMRGDRYSVVLELVKDRR
jgi:GntR family transcriptional regulator